MSGSSIRCAICKSAPRSRQITTPASHHSVSYRPDALPAAQPTASKHWRPSFDNTHYTINQTGLEINTIITDSHFKSEYANKDGNCKLQTVTRTFWSSSSVTDRTPDNMMFLATSAPRPPIPINSTRAARSLQQKTTRSYKAAWHIKIQPTLTKPTPHAPSIIH